MKIENITDLHKDQYFNRIAGIIQTAMQPRWQERHGESPDVASVLNEMARYLRTPNDIRRQKVGMRFIRLLEVLRRHDSLLLYSREDTDWILDIIENNTCAEIAMIFTMLIAVASAEQELLSAKDLEALTGVPAGTWKNRAARFDIPGAVKVGETWIFPKLVLRARGIQFEGEKSSKDGDGGNEE